MVSSTHKILKNDENTTLKLIKFSSSLACDDGVCLFRNTQHYAFIRVKYQQTTQISIDCGQSIFYFDLVRGVHAHARRKQRGEKRACPVSRLQSRAWSSTCLPRFARRTKIKERLPYMGRRIHKVVTYGEKKGKGSARRRERILTLSLACLAGDLATSAVVLTAEPLED